MRSLPNTELHFLNGNFNRVISCTYSNKSSVISRNITFFSEYMFFPLVFLQMLQQLNPSSFFKTALVVLTVFLRFQLNLIQGLWKIACTPVSLVDPSRGSNKGQFFFYIESLGSFYTPTLSFLSDHWSVLQRCLMDIVCHAIDLRLITWGPELLLTSQPTSPSSTRAI